MKRLVSLLLAAMLLLSCAAVATAEDRPASWLCDEKTTLTVYCFDRVTTTSEAPNNDLPYWKWIEDYTNVHIEWEIVPYSDYRTILSSKLAAGEDMADLTLSYLDMTKTSGANGLAVDLAPYWDTHFTNTKAYYDAMGVDYLKLIQNEDGTLYGLPGSVNPTEGHCLFDYNTAWMKKLGAEIPSTLDEFTDLLYKMKEAGDLNGNGEDDELILTSTGLSRFLCGFYPAFGIPAYDAKALMEADENGVVSEVYTSDRMKALFTYLNQLYDDGILNPEVLTGPNLQQDVASDKVGIFYYYAHFGWIYGAATTAGQADPKGEHYTMGPGLASEYNDFQNVIVNRDVMSDLRAMMVNPEGENVELAMKWIDTVIYDPACIETLLYGIPGEHWEYDENGSLVMIRDENGNAVDVYALGGGQTPLPQLQPQVKFDVIYEEYPWGHEQYWNIRDNATWIDNGVVFPGNYTDAEQEIVDMIATDINTYYDEMCAKFISGEADIEAEWDTYVDTLNALGLEQYTQVFQSVYDRTH